MFDVEGEVVEGVNDAEMHGTKLVEVEVVERVMNAKEHVGQETWKEPQNQCNEMELEWSCQQW